MSCSFCSASVNLAVLGLVVVSDSSGLIARGVTGISGVSQEAHSSQINSGTEQFGETVVEKMFGTLSHPQVLAVRQ